MRATIRTKTTVARMAASYRKLLIHYARLWH
jgi:hypothetical protein